MNIGYTEVALATNTTAGIVKGNSSTAGKVSVDSNGEMSVNSETARTIQIKNGSLTADMIPANYRALLQYGNRTSGSTTIYWTLLNPASESGVSGPFNAGDINLLGYSVVGSDNTSLAVATPASVITATTTNTVLRRPTSGPIAFGKVTPEMLHDPDNTLTNNRVYSSNGEWVAVPSAGGLITGTHSNCDTTRTTGIYTGSSNSITGAPGSSSDRSANSLLVVLANGDRVTQIYSNYTTTSATNGRMWMRTSNSSSAWGEWKEIGGGGSGSQGPQGVNGAQGPQGAQGASGGGSATEVGGKPWVSGTSYVVGDIVSYNNKIYICTTANNGTSNPTTSTGQGRFREIAEGGGGGSQGPQGVNGAQGPQGATGAQGAQGAAGTNQTPAGVSQRANLSSTSAANSINAATIGVTGTLPIANGGTGATTISAARDNLGVLPTDVRNITPDSSWNNALNVAIQVISTNQTSEGISQGAMNLVLNKGVRIVNFNQFNCRAWTNTNWYNGGYIAGTGGNNVWATGSNYINIRFRCDSAETKFPYPVFVTNNGTTAPGSNNNYTPGINNGYPAIFSICNHQKVVGTMIPFESFLWMVTGYNFGTGNGLTSCTYNSADNRYN